MHDILTTHAVVDNVLETFRDALGSDAMPYRSHVYRGLNYQRKLLRLNTVPDEITLAWALHDIGIWTSGWDYDQTDHADNMVWRWFTDPARRASWAPTDTHDATAAGFVADLRALAAQRGDTMRGLASSANCAPPAMSSPRCGTSTTCTACSRASKSYIIRRSVG